MDEFELMLEEIRNSTIQRLKNSNIQLDQEKLKNLRALFQS